MNKHLYRIVFNRALGLFQVVAEIARRDGPGAGAGSSAAGSRILATLKPLRLALALALGQAIIVPFAHAQVVADPGAPGNQRPTVLQAPNGVPLVNIQTPSAAGVSRNTYKQFDVDQQGAILNNSRANTQTELGGWVQGNPWLARGAARVILNEVNSSNPSQLRGYVEVAGNRAQLVIANPAGISCDGCGFINADRATITTGQPILNGGSLEGYRVRGGAIQVQGKGMDARGANYTDLIARSVEVNAGIWARQLQVTAGGNEVSADHARVQKTAASGNAPAFALDVGALGGMYSQKIVLVGTEHGVGMRNAGAIGAQAGQLVVTVDGRLENSGTMQARTDTRIDAGGGLANAGTLSAGRELAVSTPQDIDNRQGTLNARRISVDARSLRNRDGTMEQTGLQDLALRAAQTSNRDGGRIGLLAADAGAPADKETSPGGSAGGAGGATAGSSGGQGEGSVGDDQIGADVAPLANGVLNISATLDNDGGRILASGQIDLSAQAGLDNDGGHLGVNQLDVSGGDLNNRRGELRIAGDARLQVGQLRNDAGQLLAAGAFDLRAQDASNRGGTVLLSGTTDTRLAVQGKLDNSGGTLASNAQRLTIDAGRLVNEDGKITHAGTGGLMLSAGRVDGARGETATAGAATLRLGVVDHRQAALSASQIDLAAQSFDNRGGKLIATGADASRVAAAELLDNGDDGVIAGNGDLALRAGTLANARGQILHAGDGRLDIAARTLLGAQGTITSNGRLALTGETTDLTGAATQAQAIRIDTGTLTNAGGKLAASGNAPLELTTRGALDNQGGVIASNGALNLSARSLANRDGTIQAAGLDATRVTVRQVMDNAGGTLLAAGRAMVNAGELDNRGGKVLASGDAGLSLDVAGHLDNQASGLIASTGSAQVTAATLDNRGGVINATGPLQTSVQQGLDNRGGRLVSAADLGVQAKTLDNRAAGIVASTAGSLTVDTRGRTENRGGTLQGGDVVLVNAGLDNTQGAVLGASVTVDTRQAALDNTGGTLASTRGDLTIASGALTNTGGLLQSAQAMRVDTHGQALINTDAGSAGGILSGAALALTSGDLDNRGGLIQGQGDVNARSGSIDNTSGQLGGNANVAINAAALGNGGGKIQAGKDLSATLAAVADNTGGLMVAGGDLTVSAAQIRNRDTQSADDSKPLGLQGNSVVLTAGHTDNTGGLVAADQRISIQGKGSVLDNTRGSLSSGGAIVVDVGQLLNQAGTLLAGRALDIAADTVSGNGSLLSKGDLTLALRQGQANDQTITANGRARISVAGTWTNRSVVRANDLEVRGTDIDNSVTGEMSGARSARIVADGTLTNRGLIDGGQARIEAGAVDNLGSGRIYGDRLAIQAGTLRNREEGDKAAVIAARQRLDIGASVINNREKALIFSAGGGGDALNIGGALDADGAATGRADLVLNESATIESLGGMTLETDRLLNANLHFRTEVVQVGGPVKYLYIQPEGDRDKALVDEYRWESWSRAGRYRHKETGRQIRNWTQYDVTQTEYRTQVAESAPALIRAGGNLTLRGNELINDKSQIIAGGVLLGDVGRLDNVAVLGEHIVRQTGTSQFTRSRWRGGTRRYFDRTWDGKIAYTPADAVQTITLDVSTVVQNAAAGGSGHVIDGRQAGQVGGAIEASAGATGETRRRSITEVQATVSDPRGPGRGDVNTASSASGSAPIRVRTVQVDTDAPAASLFRSSPGAGGYLVETDPRFANYRNWLSSGYMLSQLGYDPTTMHKRLGDGFYEQKLVRDQIGQLTGRRFLDGYADDEAQYRALLNAGSTYAQAWNLRPGVALTAAQMAQLTSDIVWLVEREVTLADGTVTRALVPQVYVRVKAGDIDGNGTLLAANAIDLKLKGDLVNAGTIAGRTAVRLTGENLRNLGGRISGDAVALTARNDLDNIGGALDAGSTLLLNAGRDLNILSTTRGDAKRAGASDFSRTNIDRVAGLYVSNPNGILLASAGRDATLMAAQLINSGKDSQTAIVAGRDLTLGTVKIAAQENNVRNASNYLKQGYERDVGSAITTTGEVRLQAGRDLNAVAANVTSEQGAVIAVAQGDVNIQAGVADSNWSEGRQHSSRSLLGSKTKTTRASLDETQAVSSTFSGNTVAVQGRNVTVTGSNVVSDAGTTIVARNDLTIQAATETASQSQFKETRTSGFLYNGGVAFTIGSQMQSVDRKDVSTRAAASTVGATTGDVTLVAGNQYQQIGSKVLAPQGDIDIHARRVDIVEARETGKSVEQNRFRQSGLTVALTSPILSALQTGQQMASAASQTSDGRMQALAGAATGLAAKNAYDAVQADPKAAGGVNISITVGASKSDSKSTTTYDTAAGSTVAAGGDVRISATGAGRDSDLTVRGGNISAGGNVVFKADGDINLLAARNTQETDRKSSSASAGVGVAISLGSNRAAFGVTANASGGRGKGEGRDVTWTNTQVSAGEGLTLVSGGDTTLRGAVASGRQVVADVGGNLSIESQQDTSTFKSKDQSIGGSVTVGAGFSGSVNVGQQKINSNYASVTEQSRIEAGDGGFQVKVKGNTDLKGAAITSSEQAVTDGLNTLSTGTLTVSDIRNHAEYSASSVSLGGGYSVGGGGVKEIARYGDGSGASASGGVGTDQQGKAATGGQVPNTTLPDKGGFSAAPPIAMMASGSSSSTTRSGISGAQITITDEAGQQALTGQSVDERIASLNREVFTGKDGANALTPIFNEKEIKAGFEIVGALQRETGTLLNNMAKKADAKLNEAKTAQTTASDLSNGLSDAQRQALRDEAALKFAEAREIDAKWGASGTYRQIAAALTAAAGANVTGTTSQFAQNMLVNYVQQQGAGYIGKLVENGTLTEGSPLHAAMHAIVACSGAAASRQSCGSAALGGAASSLLTGLFSETSPDEKATEREAKRNLIVSIVTGIGAAGGADAGTASTAAATAVDNNWLATQQRVQMNKELDAAEGMIEYLKVQGKWFYISREQDVITTAGVGKGLILAGWSDIEGLAGFLSDPIAGLKGLKDIVSNPEVRKQIGDSLVAEFDAKISRMETALEVGGTGQALQFGEDLGNLVWQVGTVVTGVGATAKAGVTLAKVGINASSKTLEVMKLSAQLLKADARGLGGVVSIGEIGMQWGKGIAQQGGPFERFVQSKLPAGTIDLNKIKNNFSTFDHLTPEGLAISTKTLDTSAKAYAKAPEITRTLDKYVEAMIDFSGDGKKGGFQLTPDKISAKQMQLAIPENTSAEQMAAIAQAVKNAATGNVEIIVTKVK